MTDVWVSIIGATGVVLAAVLPIVLSLRKARRENALQHTDSRDVLVSLSGKVDVIHGDLRDIRKDFTRHLENHKDGS